MNPPIKVMLHAVFDILQDPSVRTVLYQLGVHYSVREPVWCEIMTVHSGMNTSLCESVTLETF